MSKIKCPICEQDLPDDSEYVSMIDLAVAMMIREIVAEYVSKEVGIDIMAGRNMLLELLKDERETPENIRMWFEKNII